MTSRVHHLNCGTMCPAPGKLRGFMPPTLVDHCLLVEGESGLTLVDTGFGTGDVRDGGRRLGPTRHLLAARLDPAETAVEQVKALGHSPADVRDVVVTHLDLDHAGGLSDFPLARVHVHARELEAARRPTRRESLRYVPAQWAHSPDWVEHADGTDDWFGFRATPVVGEDVWLVPLPGHTRGHSAVAVRRPGGGWLLHAGDAYFAAGDKETPRTCPPGLRAFQATMAVDGALRRENLARLQSLHASSSAEVTMFCAHDRTEYDALRDARA